ncbi:MAG: hypothetical protein U0572_05975 [Phycisphaerales bacterium]
MTSSGLFAVSVWRPLMASTVAVVIASAPSALAAGDSQPVVVIQAAPQAPATGSPSSPATPPPPAAAPGASTASSNAPAAPAKLTILMSISKKDYFTDAMNQQQGVEECTVLYQDQVDPDARKTGIMNAAKTIAALQAELGANPSGWVLLDFEYPFDDIFWNGPSDPRHKPMVDSINDTLHQLKEKFPNCKFSLYGAPYTQWRVQNQTWDVAPEPALKGELDRCFATYSPIVASLDWLNPTMYDRYEFARASASEQPALRNREKIYRRRMVELSDRLRQAAGKPAMPILPAISPVYDEYGDAEVWKAVDLTEFKAEQVKPAINAGASGFFVWTSIGYRCWVSGLAWVPAEGEKPRAEGREILTKLLYSGSPPANWTSEATKIDTRKRAGKFLEAYSGAIRDVEALLASKRTEPTQPPGAPAPAAAASASSPSSMILKAKKKP